MNVNGVSGSNGQIAKLLEQSEAANQAQKPQASSHDKKNDQVSATALPKEEGKGHRVDLRA